MDKVKVCMATIEFPPDPGGVGESVKRIGKMLYELGCEVHIVVFHSRQVKAANAAISEQNNHHKEKGFDYNQCGGLHIHRSRVAVKSDVNTVSEYYSDVSLELRLLHENVGFDIFHAFFLNETGMLITLLAKELNIPVINSIRGSDLHKNIFHHKYFSQIVWALENSSWLTFVSQELEKRAHALAPTIQRKTSAFWNSVAPVNFNSMDKPLLPTPLAGTVIGAFGRFRDKKGIDHLIRACAELSKDIELTLLLVGDFVDKEQEYWQGFIEKSNISDKVIVTGIVPREQALQYFSVIDIFAIPSLRDGCPNSLLEAMLASKAIIGSNVDAIGEIIEHNVNGLKVKAGSSADLVAAISRLASDDKQRERLGTAAYRTAINKLAPGVERDNWQSIYEQVLSIKSSRPFHPINDSAVQESHAN